MYAGPSPKSLNYYLETSVTSSMIFGLMFESLLDSNPITIADEPGLAERWAIGDDKKTFTFWLNPKARWSDGTPITAHDVKWTFDAIMDPKNLTGPHKVAMERFETPVVVDDHTIRFTAKIVHWSCLNDAGGFAVLPKHVFEGKDFNKQNFEFPVVSGLYRLKEFKENISLTLERRADYWNRTSPRLRNKYNFDEIRLRFFTERDNAFQSFRNGQIDFFPIYTSHRWVKEAQGDRYDRNWIVKQKVYNYDPVGFQGFAMNMRRFPFDDIKVRLAMNHLVDRRKMNERLMYNLYFLHRSYYEDLYSPDNPCPNTLFEFDKEKARALLKEAGWATNPDTGILEKNGRELAFKILTRSGDTERFLAIMREDFRDVGIKFETVQKDWAAWMKDMDEFNFDMTWAAFGGGVRKDPEYMWSSKEADRPAGNNITGFKDATVDALIAEQRSNFYIEQRHAICRRIDQLVYPQAPYVLLWNIDYTRLLYWNKFGMPDTVLGKFGNENAALAYWWYDPDSEADLDQAMKSGRSLPTRPGEVHFDKEYDE